MEPLKISTQCQNGAHDDEMREIFFTTNMVTMENKTLIFKPQAKGYFEKSAYYAVPMFSKMLALCTDYAFRSLKKPMDVATTDSYIRIFWRMQLESSFTTLYATAREQIDLKETYVFMSNHESWMDIPAIFGAVPVSLRMVSKAGIMKIPLVGHAMANAGFIPIDRSNRRHAIRELDKAKKHLAEGISIWMAPEGTRTRNGHIGPFKKGGFYLARELKKAIAPVFIEGSAAVMPADSLSIRPNRCITVHFCKPVSHEFIAGNKMEDVIKLVRDRIIEKQKEVLNDEGM